MEIELSETCHPLSATRAKSFSKRLPPFPEIVFPTGGSHGLQPPGVHPGLAKWGPGEECGLAARRNSSCSGSSHHVCRIAPNRHEDWFSGSHVGLRPGRMVISKSGLFFRLTPKDRKT